VITIAGITDHHAPEYATLLEAAFKAEYSELDKRNVDVTDELVRYSLIGIGKMD